MDDLISDIKNLLSQIESASKRLALDQKAQEFTDLTKKSQAADFWQDNQAAQTTMKQLAKLEATIKPWQKIAQDAKELKELAEMGDTKLAAEITTQLKKLQKGLANLKDNLKFAGPYDDHDAILSLHAGAGGTDAQDWTEMLVRMYSRWAEKSGLDVKLLDQSAGEEAGLKSATLDISGQFAYGKLKGEHGVHRLVRLSPYNADHLRQTSFAKVEVLPKIEQPEELELDSKELKIEVFRAGGHGGQSVNTTDSAVRATHLPTGITVVIQNERSQIQNRETALTILRSRLAQLKMEQHKEKLAELKGPNQSAEWGNQIRSYVLHPYKQVKDLRTKHQASDPEAILGGDLDGFINAYLETAA